MNLKDKIKEYKNYGYTIKSLAEHCNISPNTLYAYISNNYPLKQHVKDQILLHIEEVLNIHNNFNYSVYKHINKINGKCYIGLTSQKNISARWQNGEGYKGCTYFYNAIQKYGWDNFEHVIVKANISKEEASQLEKELIEKYDTINPKKGYNLRQGGINNYELTEEHRKRLAWAKGKKFSQQHRENISKGLKNRIFSEETKIKMSEAKLLSKSFQGASNPKARKVICLETGQVFNTLKEAAQWCNLKSYMSISQCCRGITKTAGGYHWKYYTAF